LYMCIYSGTWILFIICKQWYLVHVYVHVLWYYLCNVTNMHLVYSWYFILIATLTHLNQQLYMFTWGYFIKFLIIQLETS
jgi:hypothetical protein